MTKQIMPDGREWHAVARNRVGRWVTPRGKAIKSIDVIRMTGVTSTAIHQRMKTYGCTAAEAFNAPSYLRTPDDMHAYLNMVRAWQAGQPVKPSPNGAQEIQPMPRDPEYFQPATRPEVAAGPAAPLQTLDIRLQALDPRGKAILEEQRAIHETMKGIRQSLDRIDETASALLDFLTRPRDGNP